MNDKFEFVDNDINDHKSLDDSVYKYLEENMIDISSSLSGLEAGSILFIIASGCHHLDAKLTDFGYSQKIVKNFSKDPDGDENSNLLKLINSCLNKGSFERLLSEHQFHEIALFSRVLQN